MSAQGSAPLAAVTGGTGFIGGHVVAALAARGWRLRLLVRRTPHLPEAVGEVEVVPGRLDEPRVLAAFVGGADAIVHLAGAIAAHDRAEFLRINRDATACLVRAWRAEAPGARFVLMSSLAARRPAISPYAASKAGGEAALAERRGEGAAAVLRPGAVYGPGDRASLPVFRAALWPVQPVAGQAGARVALIHARDLAEAVAAMAAPMAPQGRFDLTDPRPAGHDWAEIVAAACAAAGRQPRSLRIPAAALRLAGLAGDLRALAGAAPMLTSGKVREILAGDWASSPDHLPPATVWAPRIELAEGFAETLGWYRDAGWLGSRRRSS